jgi:hypothetical protein
MKPYITATGVYYSRGRGLGKNEAAMTWLEQQLASHGGSWPVAVYQNKVIGELWAKRLAPKYKMEWRWLPDIGDGVDVWYVWRTEELTGDEPAPGGSQLTGMEPGTVKRVYK